MNANEYFEQHTLDQEFIKTTFGVSWSEDKITIPIYDKDGKLLYCKYRHLNTTNKFSFDTGNHPTLFCLHKIKDNNTIVLCEGEPDCMKLWQEKIPAVTSTGGVAKFDEEMAQQLAGKTVYILFDNDEAGQKRVMSASQKLMNVGCKVKIVGLSKDIKDVCEHFGAGKTKEELVVSISKALTPNEWWKLNKPEDFKTITAQELRSMEFPKDQWLIDRIIPREGFCFIFGAEGTGKSFTALSIAKALSEGKDWLDKFKTDKQCKVLFIDKENPKQMTSRRLASFEVSGENIVWVKYPEKLQLVGEDGGFSDFAISLSEEVKAENIDLIIIDSFVDLMVGNENAADDVQKFFDAIRQLFPNKSILALHHENKPSAGTFKSDAQRTRGSSNINAQTTVQFRIEAISSSKTEFSLKQTKARDAQKLDKFLLEMNVRQNEDETTDVTGLTYKGEMLEADDKITKAREIIQELLSNSPVASKKEITEACSSSGIGERTIERTLKIMTDEGVVDGAKNGRENTYFLTNSVKTDELL